MIFETLRSILAESLGCDESDITPGTELRGELGLSDGDLSDVLDALAEEFGFARRDGDCEELTTAASLARYVARCL